MKPAGGVCFHGRQLYGLRGFKVHRSYILNGWLVKRHQAPMLRVLLITAQGLGRSKAHDEDEVPAAGIVKNIASNLEMPNAGNGGSQGQHSAAELTDVFVAGAFPEFDQNVVL
jgi:hypothetical protein